MAKTTTFRETESTKQLLDNYMKTHRLASRSEAINAIIESQSEPQTSSIGQADNHPCPYRAIDMEKGLWYCDGKPIPKCVCVNRQGRYLHFQRTCYPKGLKRKTKRQPKEPADYDLRDTKVFRGDTI